MSEKVQIHIDDKSYQVEAGQNLLQACLSLKLDLPYFCWHPAMGSVGACRQCAVTLYKDKDDDRGKLAMACMTPVSDGLRVGLGGKQEQGFREQNIAALMTRHPHDCPVCSEGGECHLQDMTVMTGHHARHYQGQKVTFNNQYLGPLIKHEMNRCITCYRCVRFYHDYAGGSDLCAQASKNHVYFGRQQDGVLESPFAGNLVEVCPTGVFTDKPFNAHFSRKWDLQSAPSVCGHCAVGCNTFISSRYNSLRRVNNRLNPQLNGHFLCDIGRYGFAYANSPKRLNEIKLNGKPADWSSKAVQEALAEGNWIGIGSAQASLEDNFALQQLVGEENFVPGPEPAMWPLMAMHLAIAGQKPMASLAQIEEADAVLILCENLNQSAPRIALSVRQALTNKAKDKAEELQVPRWQDAAVRQLQSDNPVPLIYFGYGEQALQRQACVFCVCDDEEAARQGFALANLLHNRAPQKAGTKVSAQTHQAADILRQAKKPLIVSGWSAGNPGLLAAAANIAEALGDKAMLCLVADKANSVGLGLLAQKDQCGNPEECLASANAGLLVLADHSAKSRRWMSKITEQARQVVHLSALQQEGNSSLQLPIAAEGECSATRVNYQGYAQPLWPAVTPPGQSLPAWQWLVNLAKTWGHTLGQVEDLRQLRARMISVFPALQACWADIDDPIALQTPRVSGRTAMLANQSVHEPKPPIETEAPYRQSMEGQVGKGNSQAYSWWPGWNSNQSQHKFSQERGDLSAALLITPSGQGFWWKWQSAWQKINGYHWHLLPYKGVFGGESLSLEAAPIAELCPAPGLFIRADDAALLGLSEGDLVCCDEDSTLFELRFTDGVPPHSLLYQIPANHGFSLRGCELVVLADEAQRHAYQLARDTQRAGQAKDQQAKLRQLLDQDRLIPVRFIEGMG
ncbi:NADH-quinone oxidoreductase subunit NuoG [Aliiglaciecola sp. CAU 1673]|uniref:NADH-quinone oxidoreductase subunit NuoG n=1 Tax=Aliiglaciecola sp. CAU 1673 TaxID=3032595 RepID=UPI0023DBCD59|nr:NADH-quinone oxidoreductase subunit NuoG [Aliiglaciecola sp. CAU 1673]MDF2176652.1 NADH-quinone oxidoreductase subunit NuoG [Aliiglaciecola sp. CAU 1673]